MSDNITTSTYEPGWVGEAASLAMTWSALGTINILAWSNVIAKHTGQGELHAAACKTRNFLPDTRQAYHAGLGTAMCGAVPLARQTSQQGILGSSLTLQVP